MTLGDYNVYRGWEIPEDEDPTKKGFLVEYLDGDEPNHPDHHGYISWSPKDVFDNAYRPCDGMNFGLAIEAMKKGEALSRKGWNGKGMFLLLCEVDEDHVLEYNKKTYGREDYIYMKTADDKLIPWTCSQADMLSDDWLIVE